MSASDHRILYDANCRFCRWSLGWLLRWDRHRRLRPIALQDPEAERQLAGMSRERRMDSWHLVDAAGPAKSGGAAAPALLGLLPAGAGPAALAARIPAATDRVYRWVAGHRGGLGKMIPAAAVSRADALIAERGGRPMASSTVAR